MVDIASSCDTPAILWLSCATGRKSQASLAQNHETSFDWAVNGVTVTVDLGGHLDGPTKVEFRSPHLLIMRSIPAWQTRYVFEGLPFGVVQVRAYNALAASESVMIELARDRLQECDVLFTAEIAAASRQIAES